MYMSIWFHVSSVRLRSRVSSWLMSLDGEIFFVAMCRFPEIESVYLNMPNIHFLPVNMPTVGVKFGDDVFIPTDEPHGSIEARLSRKPILISNLWNATKKPVAGLRPAQLLQIPSLWWFSVSICYSSPAAGICLHIYCVTSFEFLLLVLYVIEDSSITPPSLCELL